MKAIRNSCRRCIDFPYGLLWGNVRSFIYHDYPLAFRTKRIIVGHCRREQILKKGPYHQFKRFVGIIGWKRHFEQLKFVLQDQLDEYSQP